ncbi:MAG TPA: TetR/AcrR family transcriptional regulator [Acidimicrobiales bacterium]|nr:TetR/AcrR family transcriptional regulator [Acidimicrobiales bacterium]
MTKAATSNRRLTRRSADATRDRIVAAATDLFAERSFDGASTRDIAGRAGVTQPLLNYHFRSKDELWHAAVDSLFDRLNETMAARARGLRGVDEVTTAKLLLREFVVFSARHPQLHRIITQESKADGPRMDYLVDRHVRPIYERTVELFESLARAGAVPDIAPAHLYYIVTGAGPTMFVLGPECQRLTSLDPSDEAVIEAHADAVCLLLFGTT